MENTYSLIQSCINGNRISQKAFYDLYSGKMYGICLGITKCREDAEDCLQTGFLRAFTKLHTLQKVECLDIWLKRTFTNTCIEFINRRKHYDQLTPDLALFDCSIHGYQNLILKEMEAERQKLPKGFRNVITLYSNGYTHEEIGKILGMQTSTSRSQYMRGKRMLKERLNLI